jgi:hypothetical protein
MPTSEILIRRAAAKGQVEVLKNLLQEPITSDEITLAYAEAAENGRPESLLIIHKIGARHLTASDRASAYILAVRANHTGAIKRAHTLGHEYITPRHHQIAIFEALEYEHPAALAMVCKLAKKQFPDIHFKTSIPTSPTT